MDRLLLGPSTTGVGMLVVFSGLVILIACIYIMTSITGRKKAAPKAEAAPIPAPAPVREIEEAPEEAYFGHHKDITIPYEEIGSLSAVNADGTRTDIIRGGRFVLPGLEALNGPLDREF